VGEALSNRGFESIVRTAIAEGCVGETMAAAEARAAAVGAADPFVAETLEVIANDEGRHAALAWRFVAWAIGSALPDRREWIAAELERAAELRHATVDADEGPAFDLSAHGFLTAVDRTKLHEQVWAEVVAPCVRVLARRARTRPELHAQA
jgi:hypothetical protein